MGGILLMIGVLYIANLKDTRENSLSSFEPLYPRYCNPLDRQNKPFNLDEMALINSD